MSCQLKCNKCGSTNVVQEANKNKVLGYTSHIPIYGKKYICNDCGAEWE